MKIYEVNGRKVWLDKAPEGYVEKTTKKTEGEEIVKAEAAPEAKAKKATANKSRKSGGNK